MNNSLTVMPGGQPILARVAANILTIHSARVTLRWLTFGVGLIFFIAVQTGFIAGPVWSRSMLPEVDDSYAYLVKTAEMQECFFQNCRALEDLKKQKDIPSPDKEVEWQQYLLEGRIFFVYHPLFSALLLVVEKFTSDLASAYKIVWTAAPTLFGLGFACWLLALLGPGPAGIALILLGTKVFPGNGIHYVVPSNVAMGVALLIWARITAKKGNAPWTLVVGTILMVGMHTVGRLFALIAIALSVWFSERPKSVRSALPVLISGLVVALSFAVPAFIKQPALSIPPEPYGESGTLFSEILKSAMTILVDIVRFEPPLFGNLVLFVGSAAVGYLALGPYSRTIVRKTALILMAFMASSLFYVLPAHPGEVFLRLWIPFVVLSVGAVGMAIWHTMKATLRVVAKMGRAGASGLRLTSAWPVVLFAMLIAFGVKMFFSGIEAFVAITEYMRERQPLFLDSRQPDLLITKSAPGDRVLYDNAPILMPFYFVHGAMKLGAVYYPALKGTPQEQEWMNRSDLRFAVTFNPLISLPGFQSNREEEWWISSPEFRFSPLSRPRKTPQISKEGRVLVSRLRHMEIRSGLSSDAGTPKVFIHNPGGPTWIEGSILDPHGMKVAGTEKRINIAARWSGWVDLALASAAQLGGYRIDFPYTSNFTIGGVTLGEDGLRWPWSSKARLKFVPKGPDTQPIVVEYDPIHVLPPQMREKSVRVLDDRGCSVLLEIVPSS